MSARPSNRRAADAALVFMLLLMACSSGRTGVSESLETSRQRVVYGGDERREVYSLTYANTVWQTRAIRSTVALMRGTAIDWNGALASPKRTPSNHPADEIHWCTNDPPLEPGDTPISQQHAYAECSGVLIGPDLVLTARHCVIPDGISESELCREGGGSLKAVFGYYYEAKDVLHLAQFPVYFCTRILTPLRAGWKGTGRDYAIIKLDRDVEDADGVWAPVSGHSSLSAGDALTMIGNPLRVPTKIAGHGQVRSLGVDNSILAELDAFDHNSGSAVYDSGGYVIGIEVKGEPDYAHGTDAQGKPCYVPTVCQPGGCSGETVALVDGAIADMCDYLSSGLPELARKYAFLCNPKQEALKCPCGADYDGDGFCDMCNAEIGTQQCQGFCASPNYRRDNCPFVSNTAQANANEIMERHFHSQPMGDLCEPIPTPTLFTSGTPPGVDSMDLGGGLVSQCWKLADMTLVGLGSHWNVRLPRPTHTTFLPWDVPKTTLRFCIDSPDTRCFDASSHHDSLLTQAASADVETATTIWHRITVSSNGTTRSRENDEGRISYDDQTPHQERWEVLTDFKWWSGKFSELKLPDGHRGSQSAGECPGWPMSVDAPRGALWASARFEGGNVPGFDFIPTDSASGDEMGLHLGVRPQDGDTLANHYSEVIRPFYRTAYRPFPSSPWMPCPPNILTTCSHLPDRCCDLRSLSIVFSPGAEPHAIGLAHYPSLAHVEQTWNVGHFLHLVATGEGQFFTIGSEGIPSNISVESDEARATQGALSRLDRIWLGQQEAKLESGSGSLMPVAVAISEDGAAVVDALFVLDGHLLRATDVLETGSFKESFTREVAATAVFGGRSEGAPRPRSGFGAAYSRSTGRVLVVGGTVDGIETGELCTWSAIAGSWECRPPPGLRPERVIAITYDEVSARLWVLDQPGATVRLWFQGPELDGEPQAVAEWPQSQPLAYQSLRADIDGTVLLFCSLPEDESLAGRHRVVAIRGDGVFLASNWEPATLSLPPLVDDAGLTLFQNGDPFPARIMRESLDFHGIDREEVGRCF